MKDLLEGIWQCAVCGEWNETTVDPDGGQKQRYTEDCFVCCHPNHLIVTIVMIDGEAEAHITASFEE